MFIKLNNKFYQLINNFAFPVFVSGISKLFCFFVNIYAKN